MPITVVITKGCSLNVKKLEIESKFYNNLLSFQPNTEILDLFEAIVLDIWKEKQSEQFKTARRIEQELKILKERKDRIDELMIKGTFDEETYKQKSEELRNEILVKQVELNENKIELNDIKGYLNYCKYFLSNLAKLWANSNVNVKQQFQNLIFPEKIYFENGTFRTTATTSIFKQLEQLPANKSGLVARTG